MVKKKISDEDESIS